MYWYKSTINRVFLFITVFILVLAFWFRGDDTPKWVVVAIVFFVLGNIIEYVRKPKVKAAKKKRR